ncbi:MAG: DUF2490 domain-containing protein, partial [Nitrospirota bacterium]
YQWSGPTPLGAFTSRTRLEQRWVDIGDDTGSRFRQLFRFNWPFSFHPAASLVAWDEVFIHLNRTDWGARQGLDQNRGFAGIGYRWQPHILTEIGYLNQYVNLRNTDLMNHILSLESVSRFLKDWAKKRCDAPLYQFAAVEKKYAQLPAAK